MWYVEWNERGTSLIGGITIPGGTLHEVARYLYVMDCYLVGEHVFHYPEVDPEKNVGVIYFQMRPKNPWQKEGCSYHA